MTQTDFNVANASGAAVRADLNAHLDAMASLSSGATAPATTFPNQWWLDTSTNILKQRDNANTAWVNAVSKTGTGWIPYRNGVVLGTAAEGTLGVAANNVVQLNGTAQLPAVDGSLLTGVTEFTTGTRMLFQQTAAPTGWTKETVHNNKGIRLQTGTVTTGGANAFTTVFGVGKIAVAHTLVSTEVPNHKHETSLVSTTQIVTNAAWPHGSSTSRVTHSEGGAGSSSGNTRRTGNMIDVQAASGHDHSLTLDLQFVDMIIAIKD